MGGAQRSPETENLALAMDLPLTSYVTLDELLNPGPWFFYQ